MSNKSGSRPGYLGPVPFEEVALPVLPAHADRAPVTGLEVIDIPADEAWDLFWKSELQAEVMLRYAETLPAEV